LLYSISNNATDCCGRGCYFFSNLLYKKSTNDKLFGATKQVFYDIKDYLKVNHACLFCSGLSTITVSYFYVLSGWIIRALSLLASILINTYLLTETFLC